jgi:hypothetical protein
VVKLGSKAARTRASNSTVAGGRLAVVTDGKATAARHRRKLNLPSSSPSVRRLPALAAAATMKEASN